MESYGRLRKTIPKETNSMSKFVREFNEKKTDGEFRKAESMLPPNMTTTASLFPSMSKLSLKRPPLKLAPIFNKDNFPRNKRKQSTTTGVVKDFGEVEYLPPPRKKPLLERSQSSQLTQSSKQQITPSRSRPERENVFITGSVPFVLRNFKLYPDMKALYEVYGNIMKITKSKIRFEHIILLRSESGPVLQGFYYDFENILLNFPTASLVRCVGNFNFQNRFHIHKIELIPIEPQDAELNRIQNVSAFALLQSHNDIIK
ncbi:uncharacterized protein LOC129918397 [Episyrphus balteatus]|uniref:uncharacterized protein LOC129918397 n=1 Tax=Episyrphus balteatus TaxID=286459 RepID=UPI002485EAD4|nr:uncharacterized protein LOC129918397 [Episyrphus balteatus]